MSEPTAYQIGNMLAKCYTAKRSIEHGTTLGFQELTLDQIQSTLKEIQLTVELLQEERRLYENRNATDQEAHEGVNNG